RVDIDGLHPLAGDHDLPALAVRVGVCARSAAARTGAGAGADRRMTGGGEFAIGEDNAVPHIPFPPETVTARCRGPAEPIPARLRPQPSAISTAARCLGAPPPVARPETCHLIIQGGFRRVLLMVESR